jgi:hypothetical protein
MEELEGLGSQAYGHYQAAQKYQDKVDQNYKSAGIYLKEASELLNKRNNPNAEMNFTEFLSKYCPIGKSRAYEVIAIVDGRKDPADEAERVKEYRNSVRTETEDDFEVIETDAVKSVAATKEERIKELVEWAFSNPTPKAAKGLLRLCLDRTYGEADITFIHENSIKTTTN